jgi:hypothetical protein
VKFYYCPKTTEEAHAILGNGFINDSEYKGVNGIAFVGTPAAAVQQAEQLLEISLPAEIDISSFEISAWCIPADIINQYGKIRQLPESELEQAWQQSFIETRKELVAEGVLEHAKDSHG